MHNQLIAFLIAVLVSVHSIRVAAQEVALDKLQSERAGNEKVAEIMRTFTPRGVQSDGSQPTPPGDSLATFVPKQGVAMDLVASEPDISQPLFLSWDSRGRLWVVEYRQYQYPAGLKVVRFDQHLRAVFDRVPNAPPNHVRGKDRITVFEDSDQDGVFDQHRVVIDGLNIASSVAIGDGGIWVLNPPYLLRYPDADGDGIPDSDPEVHLSGFGLQDTHSVANSLMWGPDGWLYGANGSTTGGTIHSRATHGVSFLGQCIWRYHPRTNVFEIYAEGGGNTFSLEIDSKGRVFSGTNGGDTRGWYYPQGSYSRKNWGKHGPLTNPNALGFFESMRCEGDTRRFAQAFAIYEGGLFPAEAFDGTLIAPNAMQNLVWHSRMLPDGSTYRTVDEENLLQSQDRWFRPVYAGVGPDGGIYIADWYDTRLSHVSPTDDWHKESGRVYRLRPEGSSPAYSHGDLATKTENELIDLFDEPNKWVRRRATLELGWRDSVKPTTRQRLVKKATEESNLESVWALHLSGNLSSALAAELLDHPDEHIRRWTVRLLGDRHENHPRLPELALKEKNVQVRSQLAATARRVDADLGLQIASNLLVHADDMHDPHLPLMIWWAFESHCDDWESLRSALSSVEVWKHPLMQTHIAGRLMQRFASQSTVAGLERCSELLEIAPDIPSRAALLDGLNRAFQGRAMPPLPDPLKTAYESFLESSGDLALAFALRQAPDEKGPSALATLRDSNQKLALRIEIARTLGEVRVAGAVETLLKLATSGSTQDPSLRRVAIRSLALYDDPRIARSIAGAFDGQISAEHNLRETGCRTLASRESWAMILLQEINEWRLHPTEVPADVVQRLRTFDSPELQTALVKAFGEAAPISSQAKVDRIYQLTVMLSGSPSKAPEDLDRGRAIFQKRCGICHQLFGQGANIGPPLDNYDRGNLQFWLPATIAPSIEIREGFQSYRALTEDGRVVTGMISAQSPSTVSLRTADNQVVVLERDELAQFGAIPTSLMPDNILDELSDDQIHDLFAYLRSHLPKR